MKFLTTVILLFIGMVLSACTQQFTEAYSSNKQSAESQNIKANENLIHTHMSILASDDMQGREAGTPGYDKAAAYVADEFRKLGLEPAGDQNSYFQNVPLRRSVRDSSKVSLDVWDNKGNVMLLEETTDYLVGGSLLNTESDITAELVFAGYGLVAPELERDDYAGLDVEGKLVALLSRTPSGIQSEERAYYGNFKSAEASKRGALGIITLYTPTAEKIYAYERLSKEGRLDSARMGWVQDNGQTYTKAPGLKVSAIVSMAGAEKLFANAPVSWAETLEKAALNGGKTATFNLPIKARIKQASSISDTRSANAIGLIPGSDPVLKNEVLVLSAHLDGIGISTTDEEDIINNGALDNAAGVATLLEAARLLMAMERPRRTILFLANTAEEKGLLGAEYFAQQPTLENHEIVANINLDMPVLTYDFEDVVVFGGERSSLKGAIESAAQQMGLAMADDPFPEQGVFTRSDHYRFVEQGVPSVMLATGMANGGDKAWAEHFAKTYHRPSDDMDNNINFEAAARFAELKTRIALQVANADNRPVWNKGDFFARQFGGVMSEQ